MMNKKYYWIKLKTDFFNREDIDFILSQENGCQYVVLYQMLCLNTANNEGILATKMNEVIIPYDIKKIVRDCKYFDIDTVAVALELFKKLGLIYEEENKILKISNYNEMIGSETAWAEKKRLYREKQKLLIEKVEDNVEDNVREENRDKSIDIRDIDIYKKEKNKKEKKDNIIEYFNNNIHSITPIECEKLINWEEIFDDEVIKKAIELAVNNNARNMAYIEGILRNWKNKGYKTLVDIENDNKKQSNVPSWLNQEIEEEEEMTQEELVEINNIMKEYK